MIRMISLLRKPVEGSICDNVEKWNSGSLNIQDSRIQGPAWKWGTQTDIRGGNYNTNRPSEGAVFAKNVVGGQSGRWPSNLILEHQSECIRLGTKKIKCITGTAAGKMSGADNIVYNGGTWSGSEQAGKPCGFVDENGNEEVASWKCSVDCPTGDLPEKELSRFFKQIKDV